MTGKDTTAEEACRADLDRIAAHPDWHVYVTVDAVGALAGARASDRRRARGASLGPLDGVTIGIKDNIDVAGLPTTAGFAAYRGRVAERDAPVVERLRRAGAVILGKLNMHEGALGATTDNNAYGRCVNPLAPGCTPGGSSGGSAAAVAGELAAVSLGSDTMGSVRIPAAYCGVWGLKPTQGLVGRSGMVPLSWTLDTVGPLARSAVCLSALVEAMAGYDPEDPQSRETPKRWTARVEACDLAGLVLGCPAAFEMTPCEAAVTAAFAALVDHLRGCGVDLRHVDIPGWNPGSVRRDGLLVSEAEAGALLGTELDADPIGFSAPFRSLVGYGRQASAERLAAAYHRLGRVGVATRRALTGVDALLLPTTPHRAFPHDQRAPVSQADLTALANAAGLPAVAFPIACPDGGLPASAQLIGGRFGEGPLLSIADAITKSAEAGLC